MDVNIFLYLYLYFTKVNNINLAIYFLEKVKQIARYVNSPYNTNRNVNICYYIKNYEPISNCKFLF